LKIASKPHNHIS